MQKRRPAFSIIEILVSVAIISYAIIFVLKIHAENHEQIIYISERNKQVFEDALYVTPNVLRYDKSSKTAEELLHSQIRAEELVSREVLKQSKRHINVSKDLNILPPEDVDQAAGIANEVKLKGDYPSKYWYISIRKF
jgi:hypothetical protein